MKRNLKKLMAAGMTALLVLSTAPAAVKEAGKRHRQTLPRQISKYLRASARCLLITAKNRWLSR